jgi:hypothetical protein
MVMGWNDHDDRLMMLAEQFEDEGLSYEDAYDKALEMRTEELFGNF